MIFSSSSPLGAHLTVVVATCALAVGAPSSAHAQSTESFVVPAWAYPIAAPAVRPPADSVKRLHVPGSRAAYSTAEVRDLFGVPDWHPAGHPSMPPVVAAGRRPAVYACAYCHLATGRGRPENAPLAGLPADYLAQQVADFRSGARRSAFSGNYPPTTGMKLVADSTTDAEVAAAAAYFSRLRLKSWPRVVEAATVPRTHVFGSLYVPTPGAGREPMGHRIIEVPADSTRHELHDPNVEYIAYVPVGSIARGRRLATTGAGDSTRRCVTCHGSRLQGVGLVPPLAGRSPSYLVRQLFAFRTGARSTPAGAPMRAVAERLDLDQMIAAAAYAASRRP
jgi:cytochrome c553